MQRLVSGCCLQTGWPNVKRVEFSCAVAMYPEYPSGVLCSYINHEPLYRQK